ncbi:Uncharacterized protein Rs2_44480 [Raphanus sativus]|nr:Uncharacterized protein Rs2_44480 [Raphanus sativus]
MRVHVNGRLLLIKKSAIEFKDGAEIPVHLVYEKLGRHCSMCFRLDHELRDYLEAKAQKRAQRLLEEKEEATDQALNRNNHSHTGMPVIRAPNNFQFTSKRTEEHDTTRRPQSLYPRSRQLGHQERSRYQQRNSQDSYHRDAQPHNNSRCWDDRNRNSNRSPKYQSHRVHKAAHENSPRYNERNENRNLDDRSGSYYREITRGDKDHQLEESTSSKHLLISPVRGAHHRDMNSPIQFEAMATAMDQVRDVMFQYSNVSDPTESAARKERFRRAEEQGQLERSALKIARKSLEVVMVDEDIPPPVLEKTQERLQASLRLGPLVHDSDPTEVPQVGEGSKRKPGRPPGKKKTVQINLEAVDVAPRRRRVTQSKATLSRKRPNSDLKGSRPLHSFRWRGKQTRDSGVRTPACYHRGG